MRPFPHYPPGGATHGAAATESTVPLHGGYVVLRKVFKDITFDFSNMTVGIDHFTLSHANLLSNPVLSQKILE
jgi:hypothetical protein